MMPVCRRHLLCAAPVLMAALLGVSCGSSNDAPTAPTEITITTETFSGSLVTGGSNVHPFAVPRSGSLTITMVSIGGIATPVLGAGLGTWNDPNCTPIADSSSNNVPAGWAMTGTAQPANFCVTVFDSGNVTAGSTATYTLKVEHPG